jgi:cobyrinic acid a,c-diamide synthase
MALVKKVRKLGARGGRDAIVVNNVWASYTHVHAAGMPDWAEGLVAAARRYQQRRRPSNQA